MIVHEFVDFMLQGEKSTMQEPSQWGKFPKKVFFGFFVIATQNVSPVGMMSTETTVFKYRHLIS